MVRNKIRNQTVMTSQRRVMNSTQVCGIRRQIPGLEMGRNETVCNRQKLSSFN